MARMIPSEPRTKAPGSERYVFQQLQRELPDDWVVMHARRFMVPESGRERRREGDADFLVLDPARGFLVLEVKGGREVEREPDGWYSISEGGERHSIDDPGEQAQAAVHALDHYLREDADFRRHRVRPGFGWGVVLPGVDVARNPGPDLPLKLVIDRQGIASPKAAVDRIFRTWGITGPALSESVVKSFVQALAPSFCLARPLAGQLDDDLQGLLRLTAEQISMLDVLESMPRVAIEGSAGTGKTLLAMEKARRAVAEGKRALLLCFNRPLADHLAKTAEGFAVNTFHGLCHDLAEAAGLPFDIPKDAKSQKRFWDEQAPMSLLEALELLPEQRWDVVVVDEGQDFMHEWWPAIDELLADREAGELAVFFDPNQDLYGRGAPAGLERATARLRHNCRNTQRIAGYAGGLIDVEAQTKPGSPEGTPVREITCASEAESIEAVESVLTEFHKEGKVALDRIVVLSTRARNKSSLAKNRRLGALTLVPLDEPLGRKEVHFGSLHRFKGLEADVVILTDVEPGSYNSRPQSLYVGASRARLALVVVKLAG